MKVVKGSRRLKQDFVKQLHFLLANNHVVNLNKMVDFEGREQFIKNMLIRKEIEVACQADIEKQADIEDTRKIEHQQRIKHQNKVKCEEDQLREKMGI